MSGIPRTAQRIRKRLFPPRRPASIVTAWAVLSVITWQGVLGQVPPRPGVGPSPAEAAANGPRVEGGPAATQGLTSGAGSSHAAPARDERRGEALTSVEAIASKLKAARPAEQQQLEAAAEQSLHAGLVRLAYGRQWQRILELGRDIRSFQLERRAPLLEWAESLARSRLPAGEAAEREVVRRPEEWREPLVDELSKDVYNVIAQLRAELKAGTRADAARTIASLLEHFPGVAPHWQDGDLLVSLSAAIRSALRSDAALREEMAAGYTDLARLRVELAVARGDEAIIEFVANQFAGTPAATDAHVHLAGRSLVAGSFARAAAQYHRALSSAPAALAPSLRAKLQLASVLGGIPAPPPETAPSAGAELEPVQWNGLKYSAAEFSRLLDELQRRTVPTALPPPAEGLPEQPVVEHVARFEDLVGNAPERKFLRDVPTEELDWVDRQLAVAVEGARMYVSNRFQVAAYDLPARQRLWQTPAPPGQSQFSQKSTFMATCPLLERNAMYVRLLYGPGGTLACVDPANGHLRWTFAAEASSELASDPFFFGDGVAVWIIVRAEQQEASLRLVTLDPATGFLWRQRDLLQLRESWWQRKLCECVAYDGGVIAALGGVVVRVDRFANVDWIRRQLVLPAKEDPHWVRQHMQRPLLDGDRLYVAQPGVRLLECVLADTGELVWSRLLLDLERIVAAAGPHVIVQDTRGLKALDKNSGELRWAHDADNRLNGIATDHAGRLVYVRRASAGAAPERFVPRLVWLDPATGQTLAEHDILELESEDPRIGPLVPYRDRLWTFWGRGGDPTRSVLELRFSSAP